MGFVQIVLHWLAWPFLLSEWAIRLVMLAIVPFRRTPAAAKGWLLLIFFVPWIGLLLYALIGRPTMPRSRVEQMARLPQAMAKVRERVLSHPNIFHPEMSAGLEWTGYLAEKLGRMPSLGRNAAEIMVDYDAILARLVADIDHARNHVHLLYFLFVADTATAPVIAALGRAVERGVACRVLVDSLGSRSALPTLIPKLTALGVDVREMLPVGLFRLKRARLDLRNHRKIAIIDGLVAFTGSQNLVASDFIAGITYEELVLRLTGPAVLALQYIFATDWFLETNEVLESESVFPDPEITGSIPIQALASGPDFPTQNNQRFVVALIHAARKQIKITTPYFIPDEPMLQALQTAVLRGVDVHLVVSETEDQVLVSWAQRSYYEELLEAGVRVHLHQKSFLHSKFLTIDDHIGLVGTSNMDIRSFVLNAEHILVIHDTRHDQPAESRTTALHRQLSFARSATMAAAAVPDQTHRTSGPLNEPALITEGVGLDVARRGLPSKSASMLSARGRADPLRSERVLPGGTRCRRPERPVVLRHCQKWEHFMGRLYAFGFWATALISIVAFPNNGVAQGKSLRDQLVGTWIYVSSTGTREDGSAVQRPSLQGAVTYTADGRFHFITVRSDAPKYASGDSARPSPEEAAAIASGVVAYTGTYTVDESTKTIHVNIETSSFPNLVGAPNQRRIVTSITEDELKFTNPRTPAGITLELVFKRAK